MLSKNKIKLIKSLADKKHRIREGLFLAEGNKFVKEIIESNFTIDTLISTEDFCQDFVSKEDFEIIIVSQEEINRASLLKTPQQTLALVRIPDPEIPALHSNNLNLCLDCIQDPGNLGTIIRIADWFGIHEIICSPQSVDIFNPKALQATMGAITRVKVHYAELDQIFKKAIDQNILVFGTFLTGKNIYETTFPAEAVIVLGSEGGGINQNFEQYFTEKIVIPGFSKEPARTESLNVSTAAAIICYEFRRGSQLHI